MGIVIGLHNDDLADLFVTVADLNLAGTPVVLQAQRINEDQTVQLSVQDDGDGNGNIQARACSGDHPVTFSRDREFPSAV